MDESLKVENDYSIAFFTRLEAKGQKEILEWCISLGLIAARLECPKCGDLMRLYAHNTLDVYEWKCRKQGKGIAHNVCRSVRKGSVFYGSHLSICKILRIMRFWFGTCHQEFVVNEVNINRNVVVEWYKLCREVCIADVINKSVPLGGKDYIVEIFQCEHKMTRKKALKGKFMFGGIEIGSSKCFFKAFNCQGSKEELLTVINEWVLPGSIVISDCWEKYDCLSDKRFIDLCSSQNLTFGSSISKVNDSESCASTIKSQVQKSAKLAESEFDTYLGEYMWRKMYNHSMSNDVFENFLKAVVNLYNPSEKDTQTLCSGNSTEAK